MRCTVKKNLLALFNKTHNRTGRRISRSRRLTSKPALRIESLEDRTVPSSVTVGPGEQYSTISAAVNAASVPGSQINEIDVYPAVYHEAVTIPSSLTGLKLMAQTVNGSSAIIQPTTTTGDVINGVQIGSAAIDIYAQNVTVTGFTVDGASADGNLYAGIRVIEGGSATIQNNTIKNLIHASNSQSGVGIVVGISQIGSTAGAGTAMNLQNNTVINYTAAGILVDGATALATNLQNNTITGAGAGDDNTGENEYGIEVSNGALTPQINNNTISGNTTSGASGAPSSPTPPSVGIFFLNDTYTSNNNSVVVQNNTLTGNDDGILLQGVTGLIRQNNGSANYGITVQNNSVSGNFGYAGIFVLNSNGVQIENDKITNNLTYNGLALNYSQNIFVQNEQVSNTGTFGANSSQSDGVFDLDGSNDTLENISSTGNSGNGINVYDSNGDVIVNNQTQVGGNAESNVLYGLQVIGGTSYTITNNHLNDNIGGGMNLSGLTGTSVGDGQGNMLTSTITITNNQAQNNIGDGFDLSSDKELLLTNNQAQQNGFANGNNNNPVKYSSGIVLQSAVTDCYFSKDITVAVTTDGSGNDQAQNNAGNGFYIVDATSTGNVITGNNFQNNADNYHVSVYFDIVDNSHNGNTYYKNNFKTVGGNSTNIQ